MNAFELDLYFKNLLNIEFFKTADVSQNGLQVGNSGKKIKKAAFAVDACKAVISIAKERKADILFVHHGLFWSKSILITGIHYERIKMLLDSDIALYAVHLPLDAHPLYGNNAGLSARLSLEDKKEFGLYHGINIGFYGNLPLKNNEGLSIDETISLLFPDGEKPADILPFGKKKIKSVGIISGGAAENISEAVDLNLDLYITGEIEHVTYHTALENKINVIAGGHYQTETVGVRLVAKRLESDTGIETCFIDVPTGF
ncbi:Nif3-like dinuclear metal center hexameric protein [Treponema pedis]|uniref:Nif3-like dinuclear metal center hexameric protein n=1 Tax=Treponema pedis TaxID=409322 RepID=UPI00041CE22B|nr:Nif3-like dinuclear metal center hexameric protein [Treponema pedis]